jgi:4'-phosphopantetheinyl transferase
LFEPPRRRFVAARAALRLILGTHLSTAPESIRFVYSRLGKPSLDPSVHDTDLRFNVAHSGELAVIAVTRGCEIGVDIEQLRTIQHDADIADRWFHASEAAAFHREPTTSRQTLFFRCWTRKEAIVKAIGVGLQFPLAALRVPCHMDVPAWIDLPINAVKAPARCWLDSFEPCSGYVGAVTTLDQQRTCRYYALAL